MKTRNRLHFPSMRKDSITDMMGMFPRSSSRDVWQKSGRVSKSVKTSSFSRLFRAAKISAKSETRALSRFRAFGFFPPSCPLFAP